MSPSDAWAVGWTRWRAFPDRVLTEHWDGKAWHPVRNPGGERAFYSESAAATSSSDAWAVNGATIIHWDGTAWTTIATTKDWPSSIAASGPNDAWAVGRQVNPVDRPVTYHWNGTTWTRAVLPPHDAGLRSVTHVPATTTYWAVGQMGRGGHGKPYYNRPLIEAYC